MPAGATMEYMVGHYMVTDNIVLKYFSLCFEILYLYFLQFLLVTNNIVSQRQDASSLLPVMALGPQEKEKIIDMA